VFETAARSIGHPARTTYMWIDRKLRRETRSEHGPEIAAAGTPTPGTCRRAPSADHGGDRSLRSSSERPPIPSPTPESERLVTHSMGTATRHRFNPYEVITPPHALRERIAD
jgi:hypothetical protein